MCNQKELFNDFAQLHKRVKIQRGDRTLLNAISHGAVIVLTVLPGGKYKNCKLMNVVLQRQLKQGTL